jgi:CRISPR-associated protein Cas2
MRMMVFFDLPVKTPLERRAATGFRKFLEKDGYHMVQYSIYARVCRGYDTVDKHKQRLYRQTPPNGSIRLLILTEKQYQSMEILIGPKLREEQSIIAEQLSIL